MISFTEKQVANALEIQYLRLHGFVGPSMSVNEMIARQTRIERQESPHCASVSFERHAANAFQSYVRDALAFSIKRGGVLYGCAPPQLRHSSTAVELQTSRQTLHCSKNAHVKSNLVTWIVTRLRHCGVS